MREAAISGTTLTWIGGGANLADSSSEWSPSMLPAPGDTLLVNGGTVGVSGNWLAGDVVSVDDSNTTVTFQVTGDATLELDAGTPEPASATVNVDISAGATLAMSALISGNSALNVSGGTIAVAGSLSFAWSRDVLDSDITGSGTIDVTGGNAAGSSVEINGDVSSDLTFSMMAGAPDDDLIIDQPRNFHALIQLGSPLLGHIEFVGLEATSANLSDGTLQLYNGGIPVDAIQLDNNGLAVQIWQTSQGVYLTDGTNSDFSTTGATSIPLGAQPLSPNFYVQDETTGQAAYSPGQSYSGPVAGITSEFVVNTSDILNVSATTPNAFIEVAPVPGSAPPGECGISVSAANGNNILDGYANSNFYTGGTGTDQFYEDTRTLTQNSWSTVVNLHSGDNVTLWGVTASDFTLNWIGDTYGAAGATGLTGVLVPTAAGQPEVGLTLAGYTTADLTNGTLSISYGQTQPSGGTPGSTYLSIHAT